MNSSSFDYSTLPFDNLIQPYLTYSTSAIESYNPFQLTQNQEGLLIIPKERLYNNTLLGAGGLLTTSTDLANLSSIFFKQFRGYSATAEVPRELQQPFISR